MSTFPPNTRLALEHFFNFSSDFLSISSYDGRFLRVNPAWTKFLGYEEAELIGSHVLDLVHPEERERLANDARELFQQSAKTRIETRVYAKNGDVRWFLWQAVLVPDDRVLFGIGHDITERRQAEAAIRASEERTRLLISNAHDACVVMNEDGVLTEWNPQAELTFGWRRDEAVGACLHDLIIPFAYRERHLEGVRRFLAGGSAGLMNRRIEMQALHRDGHEFPVEATISPIPTAQGTMFSAFLRDISDRKRTEQALRQAKDEAEEATRAKSDFLANMSHEIRTPMNSVIGMAELALADAQDASQRRYLGNILGAARHLLGLLNDILDLSKVEAGKMELELAPFSIGAVVDGVVSNLQTSAAAKGLALGVEVDPDLPAWVEGDALRLSQILLNLVSNAIKFTGEGRVDLRIGPAGLLADGRWQVRFTVSDTGIGISADEAARLFQPFQQADSSITRQFGGTGLGLAICHKLAQAMDGRIGVRSEPGRGSSFELDARFGQVTSLPPDCAAAAQAAQDEAVGDAHFAGLHFLLVEDNLLNQEIAQAFLERAGASVDIAGNGQEALQAVAQRRYDCVLMDMQMPVMDGLEAARRIRASGAHAGLPIIATTANASADDRQRCLEAGMDDFISKPISRALFYAKIGARLGRTCGGAPAAPVEAAGAEPVLDLRMLAELVDDDEEQIAMLARRFVQTTRDTLREMAFAGARGDADELGALGHRCKSSARAMGAAAFARLCETIEVCGKAGDLDGALAGSAELPALFKQIAALVARKYGPETA